MCFYDLFEILTFFDFFSVASSNVDELLKHQQDQHERIAEDIISLTRNLKHNITVSGKIIKEDTAVSCFYYLYIIITQSTCPIYVGLLLCGLSASQINF